jgi:hypothetical protein
LRYLKPGEILKWFLADATAKSSDDAQDYGDVF